MKGFFKGGLLVAGGVLVAIVACPIGPSFPTNPDAGIDGGEEDAGGDAGIDAGATGTMGATLTVSDAASGTSNMTSLAWNGPQVSTSTLDTITQATLRGVDSTTYGYFILQLANLTVGGTGAQVNQASYSPVSGADSWSCSLESNPCNYLVSINNFDGTDLSGTFQLVFGVDGAGNSAELIGSFSVTLP